MNFPTYVKEKLKKKKKNLANFDLTRLQYHSDCDYV